MRKEIWSTGSSLSTRPRNVFFSRRANCDLCIAIKSSAHICCSNHYDMISCDITHHIMSYEVSSSCHIISYDIISYSSPEIQKAPSSLSKIQARSFYSSIISYHIIQQSRNTKGIIIVKSSGTQLLQQYHIISYHIIAYHIISYHIIQQSRNTKGIVIAKNPGTQFLQHYHMIREDDDDDIDHNLLLASLL